MIVEEALTWTAQLEVLAEEADVATAGADMFLELLLDLTDGGPREELQREAWLVSDQIFEDDFDLSGLLV